eukprot:Gb_41397 [translate_table: standard]
MSAMSALFAGPNPTAMNTKKRGREAEHLTHDDKLSRAPKQLRLSRTALNAALADLREKLEMAEAEEKGKLEATCFHEMFTFSSFLEPCCECPIAENSWSIEHSAGCRAIRKKFNAISMGNCLDEDSNPSPVQVGGDCVFEEDVWRPHIPLESLFSVESKADDSIYFVEDWMILGLSHIHNKEEAQGKGKANRFQCDEEDFEWACGIGLDEPSFSNLF